MKDTKDNEKLFFTEKVNTYLTPFIVAFSGFYWTYNSRLERSFREEIDYYTKYGYRRKVRELRIVQSNARIAFWIFQIVLVGFMIYIFTL